MLHSSVWQGGFGWQTSIVNRQVTKSYDSSDPQEEMRQYLLRQGLVPDACCAMMTAAHVDKAGFAAVSWRDTHRRNEDAQLDVQGMSIELEQDPDEHLSVAVWVTAGLGNAARAGALLPPEKLYPGTINTIIVVNGAMTEAAMIGAVITATEAKAAVLQDYAIRAAAGGNVAGERPIATGTTTDAVLIAATGRGRTCEYAGTATRLGYLIGRGVTLAMESAVNRYLDYIRIHGLSSSR